MLVLTAMLVITGLTSERANARDEILGALEAEQFVSDDGEIYSCTIAAAEGDPNGYYYNAEYDIDRNLGHVCCYGLVTEVWTDSVTGEETFRGSYFSNEQWDIRYNFDIHDWEGFNFEPYI
jgi:hypothetical protein